LLHLTILARIVLNVVLKSQRPLVLGLTNVLVVGTSRIETGMQQSTSLRRGFSNSQKILGGTQESASLERTISAWKGKLRQVSRLVERENPRSDLWNPHLQRKQGGEDVNTS
ncbi:MAG: hypothetical protein ACYTX0_06030, partial [Nostoc sp.]